jgi:prenyltransferase beta subunit
VPALRERREDVPALARQFVHRSAAISGMAPRDLAEDALAAMQALDMPVPADRVEGYLRSFGEGRDLDFVHTSALARCWASLGLERLPPGLDRALLNRLEQFRKPDGGYEGNRDAATGTAYGAFVALGAYEDLGHTPPGALKLLQALKRLESADGAWSNVPGAKTGALNATAGAVILIRHLGFPVNTDVGTWILAQSHTEGGFLAVPGAPLPDLLSTATALHALAALERRVPNVVHERCLDFLDTLWTAEGGFHGHWADEHLDAEYTYYGLLAAGHLAL